MLQELGSQPLPTTQDDIDTPATRPRSGTWGSAKPDIKSKNSDSKSSSGSRHSHSAGGSRSGSASRSSSVERRKSGDEPGSGSGSQQPSPSRKPGMLDAFRPRSKSDASKKKPGTLMAQMKSAMQVGYFLIHRLS